MRLSLAARPRWSVGPTSPALPTLAPPLPGGPRDSPARSPDAERPQGTSREVALGRARFGEGLIQRRLRAQVAGGGDERASGPEVRPGLRQTADGSPESTRVGSEPSGEGLRYSRALVEALPSGDDEALRAHADQHFASWEIVTPDGQPLPTDDLRYRRALRGLVAMSDDDRRGTHTDLNANGVDLTVEVDREGRARATVFEGRARARTPAPEMTGLDLDAPAGGEVVTSAEALGERYGVHVEEGFSESELDRLSTALSMLSDEERARIAGTEFSESSEAREENFRHRGLRGREEFVRRAEAAPDATEEECLGQAFERGAADGVHHRVELYDEAFSADPGRFSGDGDARRDSSVQTALHEIAHVLDFETGASRRFAREHAGLDAVTLYGETSRAEGFAEAFALYHTDPAYLATHRSGMHDWFARGAHLE